MLNVAQKKAFIVVASEQLVDWLLSMNMNNRNVKKTHVDWIKKSIGEGNFVLTGQGISISKSGALIDGQHRLIAIRECGYPPVEFLVVTGLEDKAQMYIDQHAKRTVADMLRLTMNQSVSNTMAAVGIFHIRLSEENGFSFSGVRPSLNEICDVISEHHETMAAVISALGHQARVGTISALFHYALRAGLELAIELGEQIKTGESLCSDDPAYRLREFLIRNKPSGGSGQMREYALSVSTCISHFNREKKQMLRPATSWSRLKSIT